MDVTTEGTPPPDDWLSRVNITGLVSIAVFYLIILIIGICAGRKTLKKGADSNDMMLAGRSVGLVLGSVTLIATFTGGGYINGTAEVVATPGYGLVWCQVPVCYGVSLIVGGLFFAKKMRAAGYITMLDPLSERFGNRMGGLLFLPALLAESFWSAAVLSALGGMLEVILGLNSIVSIVVSAVIAVLYTVVGGLYSVAYTDIVQLIFLSAGLCLSFPFALQNEAVSNLAETSKEWLGKYDVNWSGNYFDSALLLTMGGLPWQAYFQRVLGSKSPDSARWMSIIAAFGCFTMAVPAVCIGAVAASTDWTDTSYTGEMPLKEYKLVLPLVLQHLCPQWVSFIGLGAISAAVMSSADCSILSGSSLFARNVWKLVIRQSASEREVVIVMRVGVLFVGALAVVMAITVQSVYALWYLCSELVYVILFPQLTMVLYNQSVNTYGSICAYISGLTFRLLGGDTILGIPPVILYPMYDTASRTQLFPYKTLSMLISLFVLIFVSYFTKWLFLHGGVPLKYDIFNCYARMQSKDEIHFDDLAPSVVPSKSDIIYGSQPGWGGRSIHDVSYGNASAYGTQSTLLPDGPLF